MPGFRYCLNTSTIRPADLLEKIRIAGQAGYGAIELWHDDIDHFLDNGGSLRDVRHALDDASLVVPTTIYLAGWCGTEGTEHADALFECRRRLEQATALGATYSIASPAPGHVDLVQAGRQYAELLEIGREYGVKTAMEYLGFVEHICTVQTALDIMRNSGDPTATIIIDPFHNFRGGGTFDDLLLLQGSEVAISHFNDTPAEPPRLQQHDHSRVLPGDGHLDLTQWLRNLQTIGYDGWLSLELFNEKLWAQDPLDVAKLGLAKMKAAVANAGL